MWDELHSRLRARGWHARLIAIEHLRQMQREIEERVESGELTPEFHAERLGWFRYSPPPTLPRARSIVVVAVPRPQTAVTFHPGGRTVNAVVPPTYALEHETGEEVGRYLADLLHPAAYRTAPTRLPLKLLAAHSGLAEYGRNNITYVEATGSFHQLVAFYAELPAEPDHWQAPRVMDACASCDLCAWACPTTAIVEDRFLIDARRCLVYMNEGTEPFPSWLKPEWHTCPVGCLECQVTCPVNQEYLRRVEPDGEFDEAETEVLLHGVRRDELAPTLAEKLRISGLLDYLEVMPRNLAALFEADRRRRN